MAGKTNILPEIQGLRAVAVVLVIVFHIWPSAFPGGYVGVDVFFVISGYLITGLLTRSALRDGRISLLDFYSKRARRLLPIATVVLAITFAGMFAYLPQTRWEETAVQIAASAIYIQNWVLAWLSVDYLGAENAASPVQHYWSLSIEEQFYFVWPLVMIAALHVSRWCRLPITLTFKVALSLIFVGSLAASLWVTAHEPARAYFTSHTRFWELALGGLLALTIHRVRLPEGRARAGVLAFGLIAIGWSAFTYSHETPFPGGAALAPTLGAVFVIIAGDVRVRYFHGLNTWWLTYLGDRSYSMYLWHWPLIAFYTAGGRTLGLVDGIGIVVMTIFLSHFSYRHIEQRYRRPIAKGEWRPILYGLVSMVACVIAAGSIQYSVARQASLQVAEIGSRYPGPAVLLSSTTVPEAVEMIPPIATLKRDLPVVYKQKCHQDQKQSEPINCTLGDPNGSRTIAIVGDSHAAQWVPALERIAIENGWRLVTFTKSACPFSRVEVRAGGGIPYPSCSEWRENVIDRVKQIKPDFVFTSQSRGYAYVEKGTMIAGLRSVWTEVTNVGTQVVVIQDTPWLDFDPGDCLSLGVPKNCTSVRADVQAGNLLVEATAGRDGVQFIDVTDWICRAEHCDAAVGNIIVWRDRHHLSATYAQALAPYLAQLVWPSEFRSDI